VYRVYDFHNNNVGIRLSYVHNEDQSINQSINQSISRSIDLSIHQCYQNIHSCTSSSCFRGFSNFICQQVANRRACANLRIQQIMMEALSRSGQTTSALPQAVMGMARDKSPSSSKQREKKLTFIRISAYFLKHSADC